MHFLRIFLRFARTLPSIYYGLTCWTPPYRANYRIVINNAGILHRDDLQAASSEQIMAQFATNSLGPLLVTKAFLPHLSKSTHGGIVKVINITSRMGYCIFLEVSP